MRVLLFALVCACPCMAHVQPPDLPSHEPVLGWVVAGEGALLGINQQITTVVLGQEGYARVSCEIPVKPGNFYSVRVSICTVGLESLVGKAGDKERLGDARVRGCRLLDVGMDGVWYLAKLSDQRQVNTGSLQIVLQATGPPGSTLELYEVSVMDEGA